MADDLVERLRTEDALNLCCVQMQIDDREPIFAEAAAEIERLRAALQPFARIAPSVLYSTSDNERSTPRPLPPPGGPGHFDR